MVSTRISPVREVAGELRAHRGWFIALGIALTILGIIAFANLFLASVASVYYIGLAMIVGAVAQVALAFRVRGWGRTALLVLGAAIYAVAGVFTLMNPLLASTVLTLMLGIALLVSGVLRIIVALRERHRKGWVWVIGTGILSVVAGIVVVGQWPLNSLWMLGVVLAADLLAQGLAWLFFGIGLGDHR